MGPGVVQVLALDGHVKAAFLAETSGLRDGARPAHILGKKAIEFGAKRCISPSPLELAIKFFQRRDKGFWDEATAIGAEPSLLIGSSEHQPLL
jgi:hypothetical protein